MTTDELKQALAKRRQALTQNMMNAAARVHAAHDKWEAEKANLSECQGALNEVSVTLALLEQQTGPAAQ